MANLTGVPAPPRRGIQSRSIEPMLRLVAGCLVLLSLLLALVHSQSWLLLTALVGLNLFQSAFTDWCPIVWVLERLGYRRIQP